MPRIVFLSIETVCPEFRLFKIKKTKQKLPGFWLVVITVVVGTSVVVALVIVV